MTRDVSRFLAPDFLSLNRDRGLFRRRYNHAAREVFARFQYSRASERAGFMAGAAISLIYVVFNIEIHFDLTTRDRLLVIFFAAVGINTRLADLVAGGRTMVVLCVVSAVFVLIQNIVGTAGALSLRYAVGSRAGHGLHSPVCRAWDHHCLGPAHCN